MATFTVGTGDYIRPYRRPNMRSFKEAASQTFIVGDLLVLQTTADKGHQVKLSGADPASGTVVGIAMDPATGVENSDINVCVLDERSEFIIRIGDTQAYDNDDVGDEYGVVADGTNKIWRLDRTETTAKVFRVLGPAPGFVHGDVNAAVIVKSAIGVQAVYAA
jgi:hypothetical protein